MKLQNIFILGVTLTMIGLSQVGCDHIPETESGAIGNQDAKYQIVTISSENNKLVKDNGFQESTIITTSPSSDKDLSKDSTNIPIYLYRPLYHPFFYNAYQPFRSQYNHFGWTLPSPFGFRSFNSDYHYPPSPLYHGFGNFMPYLFG